MTRAHLLCLRLSCVLLSALASGRALGSSGLDSPELGAEQSARAGAWVARADTPLAAAFNPAGLARQASGAELGVHLLALERCFTRRGGDGRPVSPGASLPAPGSAGGPAAEVCAEGGLEPNPQLALTQRLGHGLHFGFALTGPHAVGSLRWPESVSYTNTFGARTSQPSPQRYALVSSTLLLVHPTFALSWAPTPNLSLGLGLRTSLASLRVTNFAESLSPPPAAGSAPSDDFFLHQDLRSTLEARDLFIPGALVGLLWSPNASLDLGFAASWQDDLRATADLELQGGVWTQGGRPRAQVDPALRTRAPAAGRLEMALPPEARLGLRWHGPKRPTEESEVPPPSPWDLELDLTWAGNRAVEALRLRFREGIAVEGTPGFVPTNADVPLRWRNVYGLRLGGELEVWAERLRLRGGVFHETRGQDPRDLSLLFDLAERSGLGVGAASSWGRTELSMALQHTRFATLDNGGRGNARPLTGDASAPDARGWQSINGGSLRSSLSELSLAVVRRW